MMKDMLRIFFTSEIELSFHLWRKPSDIQLDFTYTISLKAFVSFNTLAAKNNANSLTILIISIE